MHTALNLALPVKSKYTATTMFETYKTMTAAIKTMEASCFAKVVWYASVNIKKYIKEAK